MFLANSIACLGDAIAPTLYYRRGAGRSIPILMFLANSIACLGDAIAPTLYYR
ncbi:MAG: hypothetical protein F6J93_08980 [Oscillatoria sp. SIO1A7]|nr:hypothetical protein [Oscillatoria sp. SIO1A7]